MVVNALAMPLVVLPLPFISTISVLMLPLTMPLVVLPRSNILLITIVIDKSAGSGLAISLDTTGLCSDKNADQQETDEPGCTLAETDEYGCFTGRNIEG